jgi:hypothetical protein
MKKQLLFVGLILCAPILTAQEQLFSSEHKPSIHATGPNLKSDGEIFYSETFDFADPTSERGWTLPAGWIVKDENDLGHYWEWRAGNDSIHGLYTFQPGHVNSRSPQDGYFVLPMDEYNSVDRVLTQNGGYAWFQIPAIDCRGRGSIILRLTQDFRTCCASPDVKMMVSNDLGVHWSVYDLGTGTTNNAFCQNPYPEFNISEVAGGMKDVWIRFVWNNNSHYFWCIDDIELMEGYENDLKLEDQWLLASDFTTEDANEGFVSMIPYSQLGTGNFGSYTFKAAVLNSGYADQEDCRLNVEVFKNGQSVYNQISEKKSDIWALARDTFSITSPFKPDDYGDYRVVLKTQQKQTESLPGNNTYTDTFYVTDSIYSIADWSAETFLATSLYTAGNNDGDYLGVAYDINTPCQANSISVYLFKRSENPQASTKAGYGFQYWLFKLDDASGLWLERVSSEYTEVTEGMLNSWVTLPLQKDGENEFLEPGKYIAAIQTWHHGGAQADNNTYRFTIGCDQSHKFSSAKTLFRFTSSETWNSHDWLSMIRLNIDQKGSIHSAGVTFNVDMNLAIANGYFNPSTDHVVVSGSFNAYAGSDNMQDPDGDGIYTLAVANLPLFSEIRYRYSINGNRPETAPVADRSHRVTYHNELSDQFNEGMSMGRQDILNSSSLLVYPNPSEGRVSIQADFKTMGDCTVSVMNLQGQTLLQKTFKGASRINEELDLSTFSKGIYFIRVNDETRRLIIN